MTKVEAIQKACSIVGMAYQAMGDYTKSCDCFCDDRLCYRNDSTVLDFVAEAVVEKLARDGFMVPAGFDPMTGKRLEGTPHA